MSDAVQRLESWFNAGRLLRPDAGALNAVDLSRALASVCGVPGLDDPGATAIRAKLDKGGDAPHLVFVLVDGLGMSMLNALPPERFLPRHVDCTLNAVFPSATASAITTLATGRWPASHAVPGWWTYLAEHELTITSLPFIERFSRQPLVERGITTDVYPQPSLLGSYTRDARSFKPAKISGSVYSEYFRNGTSVDGYESLAQGVDLVLERVQGASAPSYTYLYISSLDHQAHTYGPSAPEVQSHLLEIDAEVERLAAGIAGRGRMALSADHGQITVGEELKHRLLGPSDPLVELLLVPPTSEPRAPVFHVREGKSDAFRAQFCERFPSYALLSVDDAERLQLYGPEPLSPRMRARVGDFVALTEGHDVLLYRPGDEVVGTERLIGYHGGLTPDEVQIPLVLAG